MSLRDLLDQRIVVLDGAMGTMVQGLELKDEAVWRGERFRDHAHSVKGCIDLLAMTLPPSLAVPWERATWFRISDTDH